MERDDVVLQFLEKEKKKSFNVKLDPNFLFLYFYILCFYLFLLMERDDVGYRLTAANVFNLK
jgi:hypothetical protein